MDTEAIAAVATPESVQAVQDNLNIVWTLVAGVLVFTMQAGFAMVEAGFTRAKNSANIMMKNLIDFAVGAPAFYILGAAIMFGATKWGGWFGWGGLGMPSLSTGEGIWDWTFFFFQTIFAATAATIVSGAVAERIHFKSYLIYSLIVSAFIAGLALSPILKEKATIFHKFEGIGYGFLIPFLFISIGMDTNLRVMADLGNLKIVLFTVGGLVCSKILSGWLAMRLTGFPNTQGLCAGLMTVPQLSATLAAAALGKTLGMLDDNFFNAIIFLSIVTTIPIPSLVRCLIQKESPSFEVTEDEAFVVPDESEGQDDVL